MQYHLQLLTSYYNSICFYVLQHQPCVHLQHLIFGSWCNCNRSLLAQLLLLSTNFPHIGCWCKATSSIQHVIQQMVFCYLRLSLIENQRITQSPASMKTKCNKLKQHWLSGFSTFRQLSLYHIQHLEFLCVCLLFKEGSLLAKFVNYFQQIHYAGGDISPVLQHTTLQCLVLSHVIL